MKSEKGSLKVGLVCINCRHSHIAPASYILRNIAVAEGFEESWVLEFQLSDPVWKMAERIASMQPDVLGFSIYIWNRELTLALIRALKVILPDVVVVVGGPEVSFDSSRLEDVEIVVRGEGEQAWREILASLSSCRRPSSDEIARWGAFEQTATGTPVWPYREADAHLYKNRMIPVETSRGCPFRCGFCLSGRAGDKVREWLDCSPEEFQQRLVFLRDAGVTTFKFLDRTFNANPKRALQFFKLLAPITGATFHFEICGDLLDEETFVFLETIEPGRFQFEIGIQSLNPDTLRAIGRRPETGTLLKNIERLVAQKRVHIHADLIWGLPLEGFSCIAQGFDSVWKLGIHELQLGFLKMLKGSPLCHDIEKYALNHASTPPYEVLSTGALSGAELLHLKRVEHVFDLFWNSQRFRFTIPYLLKEWGKSPFAFFEHIADEFSKRRLFLQNMSLDRLYSLLLELFPSQELLKDYLRLDYVTTVKYFQFPSFLNANASISRQARSELIKRPGHWQCVVFEHAFDAESLEFSLERTLALFAVEWTSETSYFRRAHLEWMESGLA